MFTLRTCHSLLKTLWSRRVQSRSLPETVCAALFTLGRRLNPKVHLQLFPSWNAIQWKPFHWTEEEVNADLADENSRMLETRVTESTFSHWTEEEVNAALADENSRMLETRVTEGTSSHWTEEEVNAALVDENSRMLATPVTKRSRPSQREGFLPCVLQLLKVLQSRSLWMTRHTPKS